MSKAQWHCTKQPPILMQVEEYQRLTEQEKAGTRPETIAAVRQSAEEVQRHWSAGLHAQLLAVQQKAEAKTLDDVLNKPESGSADGAHEQPASQTPRSDSSTPAEAPAPAGAGRSPQQSSAAVIPQEDAEQSASPGRSDSSKLRRLESMLRTSQPADVSQQSAGQAGAPLQLQLSPDKALSGPAPDLGTLESPPDAEESHHGRRMSARRDESYRKALAESAAARNLLRQTGQGAAAEAPAPRTGSGTSATPINQADYENSMSAQQPSDAHSMAQDAAPLASDASGHGKASPSLVDAAGSSAAAAADDPTSAQTVSDNKHPAIGRSSVEMPGSSAGAEGGPSNTGDGGTGAGLQPLPELSPKDASAAQSVAQDDDGADEAARDSTPSGTGAAAAAAAVQRTRVNRVRRAGKSKFHKE